MQERFTKYAEQGVTAEELSRLFLKEYFGDKELVFPINPFQILSDLQVPFIMRPFKKYEGSYIPAEDVADCPVVGINLNRPITRQRFTAAHELCHHLKDYNKGYMCNLKSNIERYAEDFAAGLLMPFDTLKREVDKYLKDGYIDFEDVLKVADYFGVSFETCLNRIAYRLHKIEGDISIHHRLTVIHAFRDGNGRTSRTFVNMLLLKRHMPPVFFKDQEKTEYKDALSIVDTTGSFEKLYEVFYRRILVSYAALSDFGF